MSARGRSLRELRSQLSAAGEGWKGAKGAASWNLGCFVSFFRDIRVGESIRDGSAQFIVTYRRSSWLTPSVLFEVEVAFWISSARDTLLWKRTFLAVRWM